MAGAGERLEGAAGAVGMMSWVREVGGSCREMFLHSPGSVDKPGSKK